jgi:hypothetical protein
MYKCNWKTKHGRWWHAGIVKQLLRQCTSKRAAVDGSGCPIIFIIAAAAYMHILENEMELSAVDNLPIPLLLVISSGLPCRALVQQKERFSSSYHVTPFHSRYWEQRTICLTCTRADHWTCVGNPFVYERTFLEFVLYKITTAHPGRSRTHTVVIITWPYDSNNTTVYLVVRSAL